MLPRSSLPASVSTAVLQGLLIKYKQIYGLLAAIAFYCTKSSMQFKQNADSSEKHQKDGQNLQCARQTGHKSRVWLSSRMWDVILRMEPFDSATLLLSFHGVTQAPLYAFNKLHGCLWLHLPNGALHTDWMGGVVFLSSARCCDLSFGGGVFHSTVALAQ